MEKSSHSRVEIRCSFDRIKKEQGLVFLKDSRYLVIFILKVFWLFLSYMTYPLIHFAIFCLCSTCLHAEPSKLELKTQIDRLEKTIEKDPKNQSEPSLELSKLYYEDQNLEKAFKIFLRALDFAKAEDKDKNSEDTALYKEALQLYLDPHAQSTKDVGASLLQKYEGFYKNHPEYIQLGFLLSASYANAGRFLEFADTFYKSFLLAPNHYLAYKTKAIIHIKLLERAPSQQVKELQREKIVEELQNAIERYPEDHSLYKMLIAFSPDSQKDVLVRSVLEKIINENMMVPRSDLLFYVEEAVKTRQFDSAQRLLIKAREWYCYSRIIDAAQKFLEGACKAAQSKAF